MTYQTQLEGRNIKFIIGTLRNVRGGKIGFDYSKKSKPQLIDVLIDDIWNDTPKENILRRCLGLPPVEQDKPPEATPPKEVKEGLMDLPVEAYQQAEAQGDPIGFDDTPEAEGEGDQEQEAEAEAPQDQPPPSLETMVREIAKDEIQKAGPREDNGPDIIIQQPDQKPDKKIKVKGQHPVFETVLKLAHIRENIMLVGPAGCGKTHLAQEIAKALDMPFSLLSCTAGTHESQIQGYLLPMGENGRFEFYLADFGKRFSTGGLMLIDEKDAVDENTGMLFNVPLGNGEMHIPQAIGQPPLTRHKDFVCIATANTLGDGADMEYTGRNALDRATKDRYVFIPMDYDTKLEKSLVDKDVFDWGLGIRKSIRKNGIQQVMSTRMMTKAQNWKQGGFDAAEWDRLYFGAWTADQKEQINQGGK